MGPSRPGLVLSILPEVFAICRLKPHESIPSWLLDLVLWSATRTPDELSLVLPQDQVPNDWQAERDWRCLQVRGPLDFDLIGVIASLTSALAESDIAVFVLSTFDTDYLFVRGWDLPKAVQALRRCEYLAVDEW